MRQGQYQVLILKEEARQVEVLQEGHQVAVVHTVGRQRVAAYPRILQIHSQVVVTEEMLQVMPASEGKPVQRPQNHTCWIDIHQIHQSKRRHHSSKGYVVPQVQKTAEGFHD